MSDFYSEMQQMARDLLSPTSAGGLGQGSILLHKRTAGIPDPANPYDPVEPIVTSHDIRGAARGVSDDLVGAAAGDTVIASTDLMVVTEVISAAPTTGDTLSIDGVGHNIISVQKIPAAGIVAAYRMIVRVG